MAASERKRTGWRRIRRVWLLRIALWVVPYLYKGYMRLVYWTSRVETDEIEPFFLAADGGGISLGCLWHQEILIGAFFFRGRKAVTMVSQSSDGEIGSRMIEKLGFVPVRGSSSRGGKEALREMLEYFKTHHSFLTGLIVDGPRGPAFESKMGIILMARESGLPLYPLRLWASRRWHTKSWDRTVFPLPFNHIMRWAGEPLVVPPDTKDEDLEAYRVELDRRLNDLVRISLERFP